MELPAPDAGDPADGGARRDRHATAHDIFGAEFLLKRPLLQALEATDGVAPVLLIDEIDRADEEFEAYLLEILSDFQVTVPEIGTIKAERQPRVVLTSNRTREVHDALKRRCLYHWIDYPSAQKEFEIVLAEVPAAPERLARDVVTFVHRLREADLTKVPGVAETLDWAAALLSLGARELAPGHWSTRRWASSSSTRRTSARSVATPPAATWPRPPPASDRLSWRLGVRRDGADEPSSRRNRVHMRRRRRWADDPSCATVARPPLLPRSLR